MRNRTKEKNEFYATPSEAVKLAIPLMNNSLKWWECCAGDGAISNNTSITADIVVASDIDPKHEDIVMLNVLECDKPNNINAIITNPPFTLGHDIIKRALFEWKIPILVLMRVEYMAGKNRLDIRKHLTKIHIVSDLIKFKTESNRIVNGNGTGRCAWFLFEPTITPISVDCKFVMYSD